MVAKVQGLDLLYLLFGKNTVLGLGSSGICLFFQLSKVHQSIGVSFFSTTIFGTNTVLGWLQIFGCRKYTQSDKRYKNKKHGFARKTSGFRQRNSSPTCQRAKKM